MPDAQVTECAGNGLEDYPVLIVDDHELFSTSLMMSLRGQRIDARRLAVGRLADSLPRSSPGLVVLDLHLGPGEDGRQVYGANLVPLVRDSGWQVVMVSGSDDEAGIAAAIARGALGSVPKSSSFDRLLAAVLTAARGEPLLTEAERQEWLARHHRYEAERKALARRFERLSVRERDVLGLLAEGYRAAAIAEHFVVSMTTVRTQIRAILAKLEVNSQLEAVALARQQRAT